MRTSFGWERQRQVWFIPFVDKRVGVQVKLCDPLKTRAVPERLCDEVGPQRGAISSVIYMPLHVNFTERLIISSPAKSSRSQVNSSPGQLIPNGNLTLTLTKTLTVRVDSGRVDMEMSWLGYTSWLPHHGWCEPRWSVNDRSFTVTGGGLFCSLHNVRRQRVATARLPRRNYM